MLFSIFPIAGFPQVRFYENGQATRTGPDAAMYPDSPTRKKIDLAGAWQYSIDGKEWNSISVASVYDFKGKVTFNRAFEVKPEMLDTYAFSLVCYGINHACEITINGNSIVRRQGGYTSFVVPIPPNSLQSGTENSISVAVDNELTPTTTLPLRQQSGGWRTYGGIFRDIYLLATPRLYIDGVDVRCDYTMESKGAKVSVHADIVDRASGIKTEPGTLVGFQVEAYDKLTGEAAGRSGITPILVQGNTTDPPSAEVVIASPKLWSPSPDSSSLYVLKCQIVRVVNKEITLLDEYSLDSGVRDLRWKEGRLYVNGKLTLLKGLLWNEDHSTFASAMTYEALERDIASIKTLGANLIRTLYPPHPYILNLCDRYGLFVMEEIPLVGVPAEILSKTNYRDLASTCIKEMVERDKDHVSVLAWGIGDGFETGPSSACEYVNDMRNIVNSIDKRPVYFATNRIGDTCLGYVDMIALNADGSDPKELREVLKTAKSQYAAKPTIVGRYGREVEPGNRNGYSDPLSMESQARTAQVFFESIRDAKIAGGVLWAFSDWRTDRPSLTRHSHDPYLRSMGIVSYEREKRMAFDMVRVLFNGEKLQALPIGTYSSGTPIIYVVAGLIALIAVTFMHSGNRRFRDAVNRSTFRMYNFFADVRDQRILPYSHSIFLAMIVSVTWATLLSSMFTYYRDDLLLDNLLSQIMTDNLKEWFVRLVWSPPKFILVMSGIFFLKLFLVSVVVRILSMMVRAYVGFYNSYAITIWSLLPYVFLLPLAMIFYQLLSQFYIVWVFVFIGIITVWVLIRLLKGISIIYDVYPFKVYAIGLLLLIVVGAAVYGYADYTRSTSVYLRYMMHSSNNTL
ncbi:MAG TPA: glycoside hydrolase family 2 TIM barrel-domain containing protein [Bacteroidota bacterium]|nr:glycoside hydrolase family 2 TIM barrel-domain containing protein [Bacteroidota bacterium]